ncbi:MAG: Rieske (2Fe-2S) protein [Chloroflexota bacterium]|nr:Rieske (2Fe-2S) protein [Chloroflexota bacterium]MDE2908726.1 Rieske (2Fe-2S) protein [Chloroflexota bacterium]
MRRIVVAKVGEIPAGERKIIVPFRGRAGIGIFNVKGRFYALRNICPHKRGPLCTGEVAGRSTTSAPPSLTGGFVGYEREGEIIRCPWHAWQFDIATGQCLVDPDVRVKTYPIIVDGDELIVDVDVNDFVKEG